MDGVCANFEKAILDIDPTIIVGESPQWNEMSTRVNQICWNNPSIFLGLEPIEGADRAIRSLDDYFEIYFLSTPMWSLPESFTDKRLWIQRQYGDWAKERLILTHRKDLAIGDFLVDDNKRRGVDKFQGEHIHIFTDPRFPDWKTTHDYLIAKATN